MKIDSLKNELTNTTEDSTKVNILTKLFWAYQRSNPDTALIFAEKALEISQANSFKTKIAVSKRYIGILKKVKGEYQEALSLFEESKNYYLQKNDTTGIYTCLIDIGDVYYRQKIFLPAIDYYYDAMELILLSGDKQLLGRIYHKLGGIYYQQKQYNKALEYHYKSLEINLELGFDLGISVNYNNIGNAYLDLNQYSKAKDNYLKSLEIKKKRNDKKGIASSLTNIAIVFMEQKEFQKAIAYHKQALSMNKELDNKPGIAICLGNLANDYLQINNLDLAIDYASKSLELLENTNLIQTQCETYRVLSEAYAGQNQFEKAWEYYKLYKVTNDSIVNTEVIRQITEMESKSEMDKKEKEIALLNYEKEKQSLKIQKQDLQRDLMIGVILLVLGVLIFLYWVFRNKQKLNKKLEELNLTKSRFFANISHEFRTPLTLLLGPLEKLLSRANKEDKTMIRMMHRNATRLLFLDNQLLDLSKLEARKLNLLVSKYDITQAIKGMVMSFESYAEKKNIKFSYVFPDKEIQAYFDLDKVEKIVYNLLSNALKFTPEKGKVFFELSLSTDKKINTLSTKMRKTVGQIVSIYVNDSGPGITKENLSHIFDRFYQVDSTQVNNFEGTGLGLSLTKELVDLHHGNITVKSHPGKGSTFVVYLPVSRKAFADDEIADSTAETSDLNSSDLFVPSKQQAAKLSEEANVEMPLQDKLQLLLVEDNDDMRTYIKDCFDGVFTILETDNGIKGFDSAINEIPDIIISDLLMPKMDGIELCSKLKNDERTSHIPVILLTALSSVEDRIKGLKTGADDYIAKPFNRQELVTRVQNLIEQRKLLRRRFSKEVKIQPKDIAITSADEIFLDKLISFIETNLADPDLNVDSLIEQVHLSRSQLHRKLKALTDLSATEFIRNIRLKRAAQLLEQHHGTIAETVYAVGFNSLSYFSKCFQKEFNMTPKEYIDQS